MRLTLANESTRHKVIGRYEVPGNPNLIRVLFENGEDATIQIRDWVNFELKINEPVESQVFCSVQQRSTVVQALNLAKRYLRMQVKTSAQVKKYLQGKGIEGKIITEVLEQLKSDMAIDDEQYTSMYISSKKKSMSRMALTFRLEQRGVHPDVIHKVVDEEYDDESELEAATHAARKYLRSKPMLNAREDRMKMAAHLARKGFSQSIVYKIMHNMDKFNE
jgi:regulatory protein